jgi:hypothetical protein
VFPSIGVAASSSCVSLFPLAGWLRQQCVEIIVVCYGRDKERDDICVRALEKSVKRWVLDFVREALEDDWKEARNPK